MDLPALDEEDEFELGDGEGEILHGLLIADRPQAPDARFPATLGVLARISATALENAKRFDAVHGRANRDDLTGLLRREPLRRQLRRMLIDAAHDADAAPVAVVMGDLDRFKQFNDAHGHLAGDAAIRQAAAAWKSLLPPDGRLCRYGGEEFLAALPGTTGPAAAEHASAVGAALRDRGVRDAGRSLAMSGSFGVAAAPPDPALAEGDPDAVALAVDALIRRADAALFAAKEAGRDRVALAGPAGSYVVRPSAERPADGPDRPARESNSPGSNSPGSNSRRSNRRGLNGRGREAPRGGGS